MKKFFYLFAALTLAFSCQKSEIPVSSDAVFQLSFVSAKPSFDGETKTAWNGNNVVWEEGNQMRAGFYDVTAGIWGSKAPSFKINSGDAEGGIFKPESDIVDLTLNHDYKFYSTYPNSSSVSNWADGAIQPVIIPSEQALSTVSFDPKADVMVGRSTSNYTAVTFEKQNEKQTVNVDGIQKSTAVELEWKRLVALTEVTFKGLQLRSSSEKIQSVTIKAQADAALAGTVSVDYTTGDYTLGKTTNEVICKGITSLDGNLTVWFSTLPFTTTELTFEVATNAHTYTRTLTGVDLNFKRNFRNTIGISMAADKISVGDVAGAEIEWVKTDLDAISPDAEVVYVGKVGEKYYALSNDNGTSAAPTAVEVTVENNKITSTVGDNIKWNVAQDNNSIKLTPNGNEKKWLYCTANNNGVRVGTNPNSTFVIDDSGYLMHNGTSRFVGVYNNSDWRCYTSTTVANITGQSFGFYVNTNSNVTKTLIGIEVSATPTEFWKGDKFSTDGVTVTATWDDESETDVTSSCEFSGYDMSVAGSQTITVTYKGETATYDITVKTIANTEETAYTASEAIDLIDSGKDLATMVYVKGNVSEIVTEFSSSYGNISFNINDGSKDFQFFRNFKGAEKQKWESSAEAPEVGDEVVGYGTLKKYNSTYEFAEGNYIVKITKAAPVATLSSINIKNNPTKVEYTEGESFDPTGLVITKVMSDDSTEDVAYAGNESYFTFSPSTSDALSTSNTSVTVTYGEKTATITITVNEAQGGDPDPDDSDSVTFTFNSATAVTIGDYTVSFAKSGGSSDPAYTSNELRLYANNTLTISSSNKDITKIEITYHKQGSKVYATATASIGNYTSGGNSTAVDDPKTDSWSGSSKSVTITLGSSGQRVVESIKIN